MDITLVHRVARMRHQIDGTGSGIETGHARRRNDRDADDRGFIGVSRSAQIVDPSSSDRD